MLARMSKAIRHRGPDDDGLYLSDPIGFAFRRLSILDLSPSGHQPMTSADGHYTIVFNGEIYNYIELRKELTNLGCAFVSSGDTEVLLHAYAVWGSKCVHKLNGMWAFLIHDKPRELVFGSRDRFGIKPLYIYRGRDEFFMASEIKGIRSSGCHRESVNWNIATQFLLAGRLDESDETFFSNIEKVPAGSSFEINYAGRYESWRYWTLPECTSYEGSDLSTRFRELFDDSVKMRLRSDVPIGVFLSGGLDSTAIACTAVAQRKHRTNSESTRLKAFCFHSPEHDETRYIRDTLDQTQAELVSLGSEPERIWDCLSKVLWFHDEPVHSMTALVGFMLSRMTAENNIKVVLNGQGADETLAGYPSYFRPYWISLLSGGRIRELYHAISTANEYFGASVLTRIIDLVRHQVQSNLRGSHLYRHLAGYRQTRERARNGWFTDEFKR